LRSWFDSWQKIVNFVVLKISKAVLGTIHPPVQWIQGGWVGVGVVKRPVRDADHSPPFSAPIKNEWSLTSTRLYAYMAFALTALLLRICTVPAVGSY
jgi:hypothetical protein